MFDRPFHAYQVGERWQSGTRTITETDLMLFSSLSGDWNPLHTDREWAAKSPFGQRIAHGLLVLSVATGLMRLKPEIVVAFYGIDGVRFVAPTYIGDTLRVTLEVRALEEKSKGGVITCWMNIAKQSGEAVVLCQIKTLVAK